ncbi:hypothetical protein EWM64_g2726 [Hericium alpestre]|uniref:FAD-binding FR-type domain-containing protein n=1 Tax=Hericium alpestre TaxID=135208 RepID=A0A4Z0A4N2_9AGAM|nr:hypothetical protein EWM64_g2726 [Hericium alpestre]
MSSPSVLAAAPKPPAPDKLRRIWRATNYPRQVWYFVAVFIFLVGISNIVSRSIASRRKAGTKRTDEEGKAPSSTGAVSYRRLPIAAVNAFRMIAFRTIIPLGFGFSINIADAAVAAMYITILLLWSLTYSDTITGIKWDPTYYANRAGDIAAAQTSLIVALGMKNNIISLITGISGEKLNFLHRMFSRSLCIILWIHAGGRLSLGLSGETSIHEYIARCGILAITSLTLLCILTVRPARRVEYEFFLILHFFLAFIFLMGAYFHTRPFGKNRYIYSAFIFWGTDRLIRWVRVLVFNYSYFGLKSGLGTFDATAEHMHWSPGQHAYLTMPGVSAHPFEHHPFTIANADISREGAKPEATEKTDGEKARNVEVAPSNGKEITFVVHARKGFTKRLHDIAASKGPLKVFLDGPYGIPPHLRGFDSVVLITGGSGVTFTCPLFVDLVHRCRHDPTACRSVTFIWVIRHLDHINLVRSDLKKALENVPSSLSVHVRIFVTSHATLPLEDLTGSEASSVGEDDDDEDSVEKTTRLPFTKVEKGRPDVQQLLDEASSLAQGTLSVNVCGPAGLTNAVRAALRSRSALANIMKGGPSVELFVETFGLA